ncbi:MAG TPA: hypothetical protein VFD77_06105 [Brumimicrobium sp.]|nr:hypothetical protein [Brumimicrobium sp.]
MRKLLLITISTITLSSCAHRLGDLTLLSNRNYDRSEEYVLLQRDAKAKVKTKKNDVLERAVDKVTQSVEGGEFIMNATLWVSPSGKKMIVKGDVWGVKPIPTEATAITKVNVETSVNKKIEFLTGDIVSFRSNGRILEGKIIGINANGAIVEFTNYLKKTAKKEIEFDHLTKLEK